MAKQQFRPPRQENPISVDVDGTTYHGVWWDEGRDVYTRLNSNRRDKYAERRNTPSEQLGLLLLRELVNEHLARVRQGQADDGND
jgi:hypothetical protein